MSGIVSTSVPSRSKRTASTEVSIGVAYTAHSVAVHGRAGGPCEDPAFRDGTDAVHLGEPGRDQPVGKRRAPAHAGRAGGRTGRPRQPLSLIHISEPTR